MTFLLLLLLLVQVLEVRWNSLKVKKLRNILLRGLARLRLRLNRQQQRFRHGFSVHVIRIVPVAQVKKKQSCFTPNWGALLSLEFTEQLNFSIAPHKILRTQMPNVALWKSVGKMVLLVVEYFRSWWITSYYLVFRNELLKYI